MINKIIKFQLDGQQYGVDIRQVHSIERKSDITQIPKTPGFIQGVIHFRGGILPIIDLREYLKIGAAEFMEQTSVLIVSVKNTPLGLLVDSATDVIDITDSMIDFPSGLIEDVQQQYLKGIAKLGSELLILLDLEKILLSYEMSQINEAVED